MLKTEGFKQVDILHEPIPIIEILDPCEYISQKKTIAIVHVKSPQGELIREGTFSKTRKRGYMFE